MGLFDRLRGKKSLSDSAVNEFANRLTGSEVRSAAATIHGKHGEAAANDFREKQMNQVLEGVSVADRARVVTAMQAKQA